MHKKLVNFVKCISLFFAVCTELVLSSTPDNPCPEIFSYENIENEWIGKIRLDDVRVGHSINLHVKLSAYELPTEAGNGRIELFEDLQTTVQTVFQRQPLLFKLIFPVQEPLPSVMEITINNKVVCTGYPDNRSKVSKLELYHTFYTRVKPEYSNDSSLGILTSYAYQNKIVRTKTEKIYIATPNPKPSMDYTEQETTATAPPETTVTISPRISPQSTMSTKEPTTLPGLETTTSITTTSIPTSPTTIKPLKKTGTKALNDKICGILHEGERLKGYWPWLVAIFLINGESFNFQCNAVLITEQISLTAANCFYREGQTDPISTRDIITAVGRHNIHYSMEEGSILLPTERIEILHDYYTSNSFEFDLAIVKHLDSIDFEEYLHIRPICAWTGPKNPLHLEGRKGKVVGWGRESERHALSSQPKEVDVDVISRRTCIRSSNEIEAVTGRTNFCAIEKDSTQPCVGDSGSGLFFYKNNTHRWELRGILAGTLEDGFKKTNGLCEIDEFDIYVDVTKFRLGCKSCVNGKI